MAETDIPEDFVTPTRDEIVDDATNSWLVRQTEIDPTKAYKVGPGSFPYAASQVMADMVLPVYGDIVAVARSWSVRQTFGERLLRLAAEVLGAEDGQLRPAAGATGYVEATTIIAGGAFVDAGTILTDRAGTIRFQVVSAATYVDGDAIAIVGVSTGTSTNLDAGTELVFEAAPSGVSATCTVLEQNDGTGTLVGLTGGREAETETELQDRIIDAKTNPRDAGNSAEIVYVAQKTLNVPVQKAFTYPAWKGPGNTSVAFTVRPDAIQSRVPTSVHRGLVEADLRASFPTDFVMTVPTVLTEDFTVALGVTWLSSARGWVDLNPWPEFIAGDAVIVSSAFSSTYLRLTTATATTTPVVGQTIALFDLSTKSFKKKKIATVTVIVANKSWDVTFDTALGASDTFLPVVGALVCPWSQSLNRLPTAMLNYTRTLGPGEMFATLPDPGARRRRWPFSPDTWPSVVTNEGLVGAAKASGAISDVEPLLPSTPYTTTVGTPGVSVYLLQMTDFAVFPQT